MFTNRRSSSTLGWIAGVGCLLLVALLASPAHAQRTGRVMGTVTDAESGEPVAHVQVSVEGTGLGAVSSQRGTYSIPSVPAGSRTLVFNILGYEAIRRDVDVAVGETARIDVALSSGFVEMGTITVIGASRTPSRIVEAPAAVSVVTAEEIEREGGHGQLPKLFADKPGIDVVQSGVQDFNINARGYNTTLNRRVLVLQDGIDRSGGFLQSQEWTALSMPLEDLGQLELVRGPGSALYGANAFSGVINIRTPDPASVAGTKLALSGGQRGSGRIDARHAGTSEDGTWGYKANAGYWLVDDAWSNSRTRADATGGCPAGAQACTFDYGPLPVEQVPRLDDPVMALYGSARVDRNFDDGSVLTFEGGNTFTQNEVFVTGIGRVQVNGAQRPWGRAQYASDRWNVMAWYNGRRTGEEAGNPGPFGTPVCVPRETCEGNNQTSLQSGALLLESSDLFHVEVQGNWQALDEKLQIVAGASNRWTSVDTEGTLMEDEQDDTISSLFGQLEYQLHPKLTALVAGRFDHFTVIDEDKISPKAALVFSPNQNHSLRATFNQAFQTPNYSELFLRAGAGIVPLDQIELAVEQAIAQQIGQPIDLPLNFQPTPVFGRGNENLDVEQMTGYEVGYKGTAMNGRIYTTLDLYYNEIEDFVTDLLPGVNPDFPQANIVDIIPPAMDAPQLAPFKPILAGALLQNLPPDLLQGFTFVDGQPQFVLSYTNAGEVTERGVEFGVTAIPASNWEVFANYTLFDFEIDDATTTSGDTLQNPEEELRPNTPEHKGNFGINYSAPESFTFGVKVHAQESMDWAAGVFSGHVPGFVTMDLNGGWQATDYARVNLTWTNVLDKEIYHLYGGSVLGSRAIGGVTFNF